MDLGVRLADRYTLEERVASGGTAEVWRAWDEVLARSVAVKLVSAGGRRGAAFRRRFRDEARSAAGLTHPRVVAIYDYGETEDGFGARTPYLVMEFLHGETLAERLARGPLPVAEAVRVCGQTAEALAAAHRAGLVHRDVKPANVFLTPDGVKVLDFGIAWALRGDPVRADPFVWTAPVDPEEPSGPAPYLAPEQLNGQEVTPAADVYALGVLLGECLTGRRDDAAEPPAETPPRVVELWRRCRAADPADRPSAAEVAAELAASLPASLDDPTPASGVPAAPAKARRPANPAVGAVATTGLALVVGALLIGILVPGGGAGPEDAAARPAPTAVRPSGSAAGAAGDSPAAAGEAAGSGGTAAIRRETRSDTGPETPSGDEPGTGAGSGSRAAPDRDAGTRGKDGKDGAEGTAGRDTASETMLALAQMASVVQQGLAAGEIRSDVALDFTNLVTNLRNDIMSGAEREVGARVAALRAKIHTRLREGALSPRYAEVLADSLPDAS